MKEENKGRKEGRKKERKEEGRKGLVSLAIDDEGSGRKGKKGRKVGRWERKEGRK